MTTDEVIREEIGSILDDIRALYVSEGKKVSGEFEDKLDAVYLPNQGTIRGVLYLAGRRAGKMPPVKNILEWVKARGLRPIEENMTQTSLAWAIAKKIAAEGTKKENQLKVYERVITPKRISQIIDRVSQLNVNRIVTEIRAELEILSKGV